VCTTVAPGRLSSFSRIDSTMRPASLNERPVAPGPPWNPRFVGLGHHYRHNIRIVSPLGSP
jgi:hypothetical protein